MSRLVLVVGLLFSWGCGGSGGSSGPAGSRAVGDQCPGGSIPVTVEYGTSWGPNVPLQASQVVQLLDGDGNIVRTDSLNRNGQSSSTIIIPGVGSEVYEVLVSQYAAADAGGQMIGQVRAVADLCVAPGGVVRLRTTSAQPMVGLEVSPGSATVVQQGTRQFLATPVSSGGVPVLLPASSITWSASGGVGTVNQAGQFKATKPGKGAIVARGPGGTTARATVQVEPVAIRKTQWTVLVFMNAASDLYPFSDLNMNQMESVAQNPEVRFVVQWKQAKSVYPGSSFDGVRRYLVQPDTDMGRIRSQIVQNGLVDASGQPLDMGDPRTLKDFLDWGKTYFPAERTVLVLWNHGNGWMRRPDADKGRAFSYDDQYGSAIQTWEFNQAFAGHRFDIIAWDCSLMQMLEVAYELRPFAGLVAGSEESPPGEGYPYDAIFRRFRDNPGLPTRDLSKSFVDGMVNDPRYTGRKITQSVVDTTKLPALAQGVDKLGRSLFAAKDVMADDIREVRQTAQAYSPTRSRTYRDLIDVCRLLGASPSAPTSVRTAAGEASALAQAAVVWEGHNQNSPNSRGLSIDFSSGLDFLQFQPDYSRLALARATFWDEWLAAAP
ncbi:MAG: hypothetical protein KF884_00555 [Fimbriimonadaceae bacterium]|nr:hypothetical protein [Fimbriimonadaceae bacterium]QYK58586.1 MAG: hypothetical protein KF884_00555 [Fimbriimonadaceae bacterium]